MRLEKYIADCGVTSRRKAKQLVKDKKVSVNKKVITEPGFNINPETDKILVENKAIKPQSPVYFLFNKPKGYVCTKEDKHAEKKIYDLLPKIRRLVSVGRLDKDSRGLLILTSDGDLNYKLTHPSFEHKKVYDVVVKGRLSKQNIKALENGITYIDDEGIKVTTKKAQIEIKRLGNKTSRFLLTIHEGRKRQIRHMCQEIGHEVIDLKRIKMGSLELGDLVEGHYRKLTNKEIEALKNVDV